MHRFPFVLLLAIALFAATTVDAGDLLIATDRASGLALAEEDGVWTLQRAGAEAASLTLPADFEGYRIEALADGWVLTGSVFADGHRDLVLVRGEGERQELLPVPGERDGRLRDGAVPLIEDGRLVGLAWLEGERFDALRVRATQWLDGGWGRVEEISAPDGAADPAGGTATETWSSRLALAGTVLTDGRWLLAWSAFDGSDDEIVWSERLENGWTRPERLATDNEAPDVTPTVVATARGALAAWSAFADGHYRLGLARLDDDGWHPLPLSEDRGATDPQALAGVDRLAVVYRTVVPDGIHLVELDRDGRILRRGLLPAQEARSEDASGAPGAIAFHYLAFGDSITFGDHDELNLGGYPGRLGQQLGCSPGVCWIDNQGLGGERTGQAVTRIDSVLAAQRYDVMMLMEGTNDIFKQISNNTIQFNLTTIADKAEAAGVEPLLASIIHFHPDGKWKTSKDPQVQDLRNRLQALAGVRGYTFADPWTPLCPNRPCFDAHYFSGVPSPDPVGHPDASGYDIMTTVFFDRITAVPKPGAPTGVSPAGQQTATPTAYTWNRESPVRASWYELEIRGPGEPVFSRWYSAAKICNETSCTARAEIALPQGSYTWKVMGRNPAGYSPWSSQVAFSIVPGGGATLSLVSGGCAVTPTRAEAPTRAPATATIAGDGFPPNTEIGVIMAGSTSGFVKGGTLCNGLVFEIGEPFVLPPTWVVTDGSGSFTTSISGEKCFVQALIVNTCDLSNVLVLP